MKNPLRKRLFRELKGEAGKYFAAFFLMTAMIAFVSGFLVADGSMLKAYRESFSKYRIEDGNFRTAVPLSEEQKEKIQGEGVRLYENTYLEVSVEEKDSTLRIFAERAEVNRICLMKGKMPESDGEIAVDRMYADNQKLSVGDHIRSSGREWTITGLVAFPDYSCLFQDNNDSMFDSVKFGVAAVNPEEFDALGSVGKKYSYSWVYDKKPGTDKEERDAADSLMEAVGNTTVLEDFVPQYLNRAITFTGDDMGSDRMMILFLLYIVVVIMAFVFGVNISNTMRREAGVIGTLRASGYTRRELLHHYMGLPVLVTLTGAFIGNLLGYTVMKNVCVSMYYGSYSLPTYETVWNGEAFLLTTVIPVLIVLAVDHMILRRRLKLPIQSFLRKDLSVRRRKKAVYLNPGLPIFTRLRLRVIFQNIGGYLILFAGVVFANLLLMFGLLMPSVLAHYQEDIQKNMLADYQYLLEMPASAVSGSEQGRAAALMGYFGGIETDNEDAEKFSAYSLNTVGGKYESEEILLYGVQPDSRYVKADVENGTCISSAYAEKFRIKKGDTITLKEQYGKKKYELRVEGVYDYSAALCVFMEQEKLNRMFDLGDDYFGGYFSSSEITDIPEQYIGSVIDLDALTKLSRQLDVSMGSAMMLVNGFAVLIFLVLVYLLSKAVVEKNTQSISMIKILGYSRGEIGRLYILPTAVVLVLCVLVSLPIERELMEALFREMMLSSISGWIPFWVDPVIYVKMIVVGLLAYAFTGVFEFRRIRRIPMEEALKNME